MTHRRVAAWANVPPSTPGYFFPSIDDLILAAFRTIMTTMVDDHDALTERIRQEDMDREAAVDAYIDLITRNARKFDHLQYEGYLFANHRPALGRRSTRRSRRPSLRAARRTASRRTTSTGPLRF